MTSPHTRFWTIACKPSSQSCCNSSMAQLHWFRFAHALMALLQRHRAVVLNGNKWSKFTDRLRFLRRMGCNNDKGNKTQVLLAQFWCLKWSLNLFEYSMFWLVSAAASDSTKYWPTGGLRMLRFTIYTLDQLSCKTYHRFSYRGISIFQLVLSQWKLKQNTNTPTGQLSIEAWQLRFA